MNIQPFNDQIYDLALRGCQSYSDLTTEERRSLVASLILKKNYIEISGDYSYSKLPNLMAEAIMANDDMPIKALFDWMMRIFVHGTSTREAYFSDDIDEALQDAAAIQENSIGYLEDLRQEDARERAKDMQQEFRNYY